MYQTPILFLIFNRPDLTKQVFGKIRAVKPEYLYVSADGPRVHKSEDVDLCAQTRQIVQEGIDWTLKAKSLARRFIFINGLLIIPIQIKSMVLKSGLFGD